MAFISIQSTWGQADKKLRSRKKKTTWGQYNQRGVKQTTNLEAIKNMDAWLPYIFGEFFSDKDLTTMIFFFVNLLSNLK